MAVPELVVTVAEAERYFSARLWTEVWDEASEADKERAIGWACALVRSGFVWNVGAWRVGVWDSAVKGAVCEEAIWLLGRDPTRLPELLTKGIKEAAAGSVSVKLSAEFTAPLLARSAVAMVGGLGSVRGAGVGTVCAAML